MKDYIFDEKSYIENMIKHNFVDKDNPCRTIKKLARYNYYVLGLKDKENYNKINDYMRKNCEDYTEIAYYKSIQGCIKDVNKSQWKNIKQVIITTQELEAIKSLNDDRQEKIAFVLLADAKYDNTYKNQTLNLSYLNMSDLYRLSRVTMPIKDRAIFLHFLYNNGLVDVNLNPSSISKKLNYVSESDSDVELILTENNYKELAFTYLNWKYGGYKECKGCGILIKSKKNTQYCKLCKPKYTPIDVKTIICQDCGEEILISGNSNRKIRCDRCQHNKQLEYQRAAMSRSRNVK